MAIKHLKQINNDLKRLTYSNNSIYFHFIISIIILTPLIIILIPFVLISIILNLILKKKIIKEENKNNEENKNDNIKINKNNERKYDLVLFGATGFTGKLAANYLAKKYGTKTFKWAIAGRRKDALEKIKSELIQYDANLSNLSLIIADSSKPESLRDMVQSTKVVITTAGPFDRYGSDVVRFCAENGTHYCDITGETDWVRKMIDKYDDVARQSGARVVSFCGHDCVPWDLIVMECANELKKKNESLTEIKLYDEIVAAPSGGTLETLFHSLENRVQVKTALGFDPMLKLLEPNKKSEIRTSIKNTAHLTYSKQFKSWIGPFLMSAVNGNCVRRSNAILNYGDNLKYTESTVYPSFMAGYVTLAQLILLGEALFIPPLQWFLRKYVLPSPGEGPSIADMDQGFLNVNAIGKGSNGTVVKAELYFPTDPGYRDTARMLVEAGLALALQEKDITSTKSGGIYTPATGIGSVLTKRLVNTGCSFGISIEESENNKKTN